MARNDLIKDLKIRPLHELEQLRQHAAEWLDRSLDDLQSRPAAKRVRPRSKGKHHSAEKIK